MKDAPNIQQLDHSVLSALIPCPPGVFVTISEPEGLDDVDPHYFVERDGRHFLRVLHQVGDHQQVYLLEVFPEESVG